MLITAISDTHNKLDKVIIPECDVLVHAGDATMMGTERELRLFNSHVKALKDNGTVGKIVMIAGNHDWGFQHYPMLVRDWIPDVDYYLQDSGCEIDGVKFYGSPFQPWFCDWAFNLPRKGKELKRKWDLIPENIDVLLTHGPPKMILDYVPRGENVGCELLFDRLLKAKPKYHVFGHIHYSYGWYAADSTYPVTSFNASICNERYEPINGPWTIEI